MKKKSLLFLLLLISVLSFAQLPQEVQGWGLKFEDNFDGNTLNPEKWKVGAHWLGIPGIAANHGDNITVQNGYLNIKGHKKTTYFGGKKYNYSSGEISTFKRFRSKYGYYEARIKFDAIRGAWPAFWMMPDRGDYGIDSKNHQSFINFDINSITENSVDNAILKVKVTDMDIDNVTNITIHKLLDTDWNENDITWNNKPAIDPVWLLQATGSQDASLLSLIKIGTFIEIDVTDYINKQLADNESKAGFALLDNFMRDKVVQIGSKDASNEDDRPFLDISGNIIYPSDDAYVKGGSASNQNFGSKPYLLVSEPWKRTSSTSNGGMEYDIMEALGVWGADKIQHALHWDDYGANHKTTTSGKITIEPTADDFHTYGMLWDFGKVTFYIDGEESWSYENARVGTIPSFILLSQQMGGWDGNNSPSDASLPANMVVDYVRVYDKNIDAVVDAQNTKDYKLSVFPNPILNNELQFTIEGIMTKNSVPYFITDILGRNVYHGYARLDNDNKAAIRLSLDENSINKGLYFLKVGNTTVKFEIFR